MLRQYELVEKVKDYDPAADEASGGAADEALGAESVADFVCDGLGVVGVIAGAEDEGEVGTREVASLEGEVGGLAGGGDGLVAE